MWKLYHTYNWSQLTSEFNWVRDMEGVPQDPIHHAEGDVWIHTEMVVKSLMKLPEFMTLGEQQQHVLIAAAVMHDIEKRSTTTEENGRIISPGHAKKGEKTTRAILFKDIPTPFKIREEVSKLVRFHGLPIWALDKPNTQKAIIAASLQVSMKSLYLLAKSDILGRICTDEREMLDRVEYFKELCLENHCWESPREFPSSLARFNYFQKEKESPDYDPFDNTNCQVIMMCAVPGAGKDTYISRNFKDWKVISLDDIRCSLKISPTDKKGNGRVVQLAKEQAREYLRSKTSFVWNATNITRQMRDQLISLFTTYKARITIVYLEVPYPELMKRNRTREHPIPQGALDRLINKLEPPALDEAHEVIWEAD